MTAPKPPLSLTPRRTPMAQPDSLPFLCNRAHMPYNNAANIELAFAHDPDLQTVVWYDEFLQRILTGEPAREWVDADDTRLAIYLQRTHGLVHVTPRQVRDVVNTYALARPRHAVREWLQALIWDEQPRIATAFTDYWDAQPTTSQPAEYLQAVSHNFFIGLIARVMHPGCQLDEMVIFESDQGRGKTQALRSLGGPWYAAAHEQVTRKDFFQDLQGKWVIEISELSAFSKAQVERIKHVISTPVDRYRGSYDQRSSDHPRQCVFAGTTNTDDWGTDDTGLRRFWPVRCGYVNRPHLEAARDQLFAEAMVRYHAAEPWWTVPDCTKDVQAERQASDEWEVLILPWLVGKTDIRIYDVLTGALKFAADRIDRAAQLRVGRILRCHGWQSRMARVGGDPGRFWAKST
jgi:putative DNA primase/helicase